MKWPIAKLGNLASFRNGLNYTAANFGSGIKVINVKDFKDRSKPEYESLEELDPAGLVDEDDLLRDGDVVFVRSNGNRELVGRSLFIDQPPEPISFSAFSIRARFFSDRAVPRFFAYFFRSQMFRQALSLRGAGTNICNLNQGILKEFDVPLPQHDVQERVVEFLLTYDNLIENNLRRMALLEEAARQLYQEWFVRLRFPGHEQTGITGGVPQGWEWLTLDDLCKVGRGSSPRPINAFMDGTIPWFKIGDATASESVFIFNTKEHVTEEGSKKSVFVEPGDFILSNSATCGMPYFAGVRGCVHDGWLHFAGLKRITRQFLYCYFFFKREELNNSVGDGSTQKNLNTAAVGRLRLSLPRSDALIKQFADIQEPWFSMVFNLARQNNQIS
jgi:type I restriction enzyme, S subunit